MRCLEFAGATFLVPGLQLQMLLLPLGPLYLPYLIQFFLQPLSIFLSSSFLIMLSTEIGTSIKTTVFCTYSVTTVSAWLVSSCLESKVPQNLKHQWDLGTSTLYAAQRFLDTIPTSWLFLSVYAVLACILYPVTVYWLVSWAPLHSLQLGCCQLWSVLPLWTSA